LTISEILVIKNTQNVGLVIIDGIKDVVNSINDESEATKTATKLMEWSANYNLHIITVLHQNKNDENSRGHLGTELENKAESVINVRKSDTHPECSEIESKRMRDIAFDKIAFGIDENNVPFETELSSGGVIAKKPKVDELTDKQHKQLLTEIFSKKDYYGYKELQIALKETSVKFDYFLNESKCVALIKLLRENKLVEIVNKKYTSTLDKLW